MKTYITILIITAFSGFGAAKAQKLSIGYFGDTIVLETTPSFQVALHRPVNETAIKLFYSTVNKTDHYQLIHTLIEYKTNEQLDDWLFYQLIRRAAQQISPKEKDYERYTLYKWFLLVKCGYNAQLAFAQDKLLFYVQSDDAIYDIPLFKLGGKQFVCLNIHDFEKIDFANEELNKVDIILPEAIKAFSYKVNHLPDFKTFEVDEKELVFYYNDVEDRYKVKLNPHIKNVFNNYPSVDFDSYFNIPLSDVTYRSLIPLLRKKLKHMKQQKGIDYLMNFTRHAFMYETDQVNFGTEKRLSPEQTLMNKFSDCDDRVGLFYYLVKEIYNLPMIVLVYPTHVTLAIELQNPVGRTILHKGKKFSVCEPTPQRLQLPIGELMPELQNVSYHVEYEYLP